MLAERKDLGQLRASEAGTGSKSPHPISVILTKASKARGAEGPRTASRQRSRYRFQVAASKFSCRFFMKQNRLSSRHDRPTEYRPDNRRRHGLRRLRMLQ